jgi:hypothetical protein
MSISIAAILVSLLLNGYFTFRIIDSECDLGFWKDMCGIHEEHINNQDQCLELKDKILDKMLLQDQMNRVLIKEQKELIEELENDLIRATDKKHDY